MRDGHCTVEGCTATRLKARGLCNSHYLRWLRYGDPLGGGFSHGIDPVIRFMAKVRKDPDGCWIWIASTVHRDPDLYGLFWAGGPLAPRAQRGTAVPRPVKPMTLAHRWSYQHFNGPIPEGLSVCHTCDRPPCVNPAHLFLGTYAENQQDSIAKGRWARFHKVRGEDNVRAKLTAANVAAIRAASTGRYGEVSALAREYGISSGNVSKILKRQIWPDVA